MTPKPSFASLSRPLNGPVDRRDRGPRLNTARVLRFGEKLSLERRAEYLERRAHECYLTDETEPP